MPSSDNIWRTVAQKPLVFRVSETTIPSFMLLTIFVVSFHLHLSLLKWTPSNKLAQFWQTFKQKVHIWPQRFFFFWKFHLRDYIYLMYPFMWQSMKKMDTHTHRDKFADVFDLLTICVFIFMMLIFFITFLSTNLRLLQTIVTKTANVWILQQKIWKLVVAS